MDDSRIKLRLTMFGQDDLNENEAPKSLIFLSFFTAVGADDYAEVAI